MMYPPKANEAEGKDYASHPVCSGPFTFVDRVAQDHVTLAWGRDYADVAPLRGVIRGGSGNAPRVGVTVEPL